MDTQLSYSIDQVIKLTGILLRFLRASSLSTTPKFCSLNLLVRLRGGVSESLWCQSCILRVVSLESSILPNVGIIQEAGFQYINNKKLAL